MKLKKSAFLMALVLMVTVAFAGCGDTKAVLEYSNSITDISQEISTTMGDMSKSLTSLKPGNKESVDALLPKIDAAKTSCEKLRDLEAPKQFAEVQSKVKEGAEKYLEALDKYKEAVQMCETTDIDVTAFQKALTDGSQLFTDGAKVMSDAVSSMGSK